MPNEYIMTSQIGSTIKFTWRSVQWKCRFQMVYFKRPHHSIYPETVSGISTVDVCTVASQRKLEDINKQKTRRDLVLCSFYVFNVLSLFKVSSSRVHSDQQIYSVLLLLHWNGFLKRGQYGRLLKSLQFLFSPKWNF